MEKQMENDGETPDPLKRVYRGLYRLQENQMQSETGIAIWYTAYCYGGVGRSQGC